MPRLKLKIRNTEILRGSSVYVPKSNTYIGRVVQPKPKWLNHNQFMLTTGDYESPVRILEKQDILEAWIDRKDVDDGVYLIPGETSTYVVTRGPLNRFSCTCTAYRYRAMCSHIDAVRSKQ